MRRSLWLPVLFAAAVMVILAAAATWTIWRLERSLERELGERLEAVATATAAVVDPGDLLELQIEGTEGLAYGRVLVELEVIRRVTQSADVFVVAPDGTVLFDLLNEATVGDTSPQFLTERVAAAKALAGEHSSTRLYRAGEFLFKTGFAPVYSAGGEVIAVAGVEADADFLGILRETRQNLLITLLPAIAAVFLLSALFVRLSLARQRLEREFARAENLAAVGELAATLAHEVRNPLGVIKRSAERLKRRYRGEESDLLEYITEECDRLAETVRRYLDFARPAPHGERFGDIEEAARATVALLESECRERRINLNLDLREPGPWQVPLGTEELKQVLLNLTRNSLEAFALAEGARPEGAVPAAGVEERQRRIDITLESLRGKVRLRFADNGPGMERATLRRAREPFFTTRAKGSGLGLAIIDRLTREVGGQLQVKSAPGQGTTVDLWLPHATEKRGRKA
jgi:signal transduction histidine kinase